MIDRVFQIAMFVVPFVISIGLMAWHMRHNPSPHSTRRDPFPAARRVWKVAAVAIWGVGMLAMTTYTYLWYDYQQNKPRIAQASIGRVYPEYMRAATVYLTHAEKARLDLSGNVSFVCVVAWFIVFAVMQRQQQGVDKQRYMRPK